MNRLASARRTLRGRLASGQSGLSKLETLGVVSIVFTIVAFIPPLRGLAAEGYDSIFNNVDASGEPTSFSLATKGILITVIAVASMIGTAYLVLYTNVGARLGLLITGAALFGWLVIGSALFVVYAPRGLRPANLEGLNSFQIRIPAIAMTLGSLILFIIFVVALDRYEREGQE